MRFRPDLQISARALGGAGQRLIDTPHLGATMKTLFSVLLLAITAFAQNNRVLPKGAEIKVRTDSAIPAKPARQSGAARCCEQWERHNARPPVGHDKWAQLSDHRRWKIELQWAGREQADGQVCRRRRCDRRCVGSAPGRRQGSCHRSSGRRGGRCRSGGLSRPEKGDSC